jgi:hypothetical protein
VTHLGDRVSAYVDGQLPIGLTERMTAHLAVCASCRGLVQHERRIKRAVTALQEPLPAPDFMGALLALGGPSGPLPPRDGHVPGSPRPPLVAFRADMRRVPAYSLAPSGDLATSHDLARSGGTTGTAALSGARRRWGGALLGAATMVGAGILGVGLAPGGGSSAPLVRMPTSQLLLTPAPFGPQNVSRRLSRETPTRPLTPWTGAVAPGGASPVGAPFPSAAATWMAWAR